MKKALLLPLLALLVFVVSSCSKNDSPSVEEVRTTLVGTWTGNYPTPGTQLSFENQYGEAEQKLTFREDGTYDMERNGVVILENGTYVASAEVLTLNGRDVSYLIEAISDNKVWFEIDGDTYTYKKD